MNSAESLTSGAAQRPGRGRFRRRLRRLRSRLYRTAARKRHGRRTRPGPPARVDRKRHWRGSSPLKRSARIFVYGGVLLSLVLLAWAVDAVLARRPVPLDNRIRLVPCESSGCQAAREYSLIRPPRTGFRWIGPRSRSTTVEWPPSCSPSGTRWAMPWCGRACAAGMCRTCYQRVCGARPGASRASQGRSQSSVCGAGAVPPRRTTPGRPARTVPGRSAGAAPPSRAGARATRHLSPGHRRKSGRPGRVPGTSAGRRSWAAPGKPTTTASIMSATVQVTHSIG